MAGANTAPESTPNITTNFESLRNVRGNVWGKVWGHGLYYRGLPTVLCEVHLHRVSTAGMFGVTLVVEVREESVLECLGLRLSNSGHVDLSLFFG
jgi:hypothetical protein